MKTKGGSIIDIIIKEIISLLKQYEIPIVNYKRINVPTGQKKTVVILSIKGEKEYVLKIVDVTPEIMLEDNNGVVNDEIRNEIIWKSKRIFNEIEMSKKCSNLPQLRKIKGEEYYRYLIANNSAYMYYIEEKIEGEMLKYKTEYTIEDILSFLEQMAQNIKIMSNSGYIHRDIKPNHIIEKNGRYFLIDGGLCKKIDDEENITVVGGIIGTIRYLAPEQEKIADNMRWTFQTDLYPIGIIATEMYIPATRQFSIKDIRDIQIVAKEWMKNRNDQNSISLFRRIIVNLLSEIRALRFNDINEFIDEIEKFKKEVIK